MPQPPGRPEARARRGRCTVLAGGGVAFVNKSPYISFMENRDIYRAALIAAFEQSGLTQSELAKRTGKSKQYISDALRRQDRSITASVLEDLLSAIGYGPPQVGVSEEGVGIFFQKSTAKT